jgi:hypothetical protein
MTVKIWFQNGLTDTIYFKDQDDLAKRMPEFMMSEQHLGSGFHIKKTKLISKD